MTGAASQWDRKCKPMAHVNAGRSWTLRAPANEDATIGIMEQEPQRSSNDNARELRLLQPSITTCGIHTTTQREHICFQTIVLYKCKFANSYINTLQMSSFYTTFYGQVKYVLHMGVCSAWHDSHLWAWDNLQAICVHVDQVHFSVSVWTGIIGATVTGPYLLFDSLIDQCSPWAAWRCASSCETEVVVSTRLTSRILWGRCPEVVKTTHGGMDVRGQLHSILSPDQTLMDFFCWDMWRIYRPSKD
jgi:hypothetical protein